MNVCIVCSVFSLRMYSCLGKGECHVAATSHVAEVSHALAIALALALTLAASQVTSTSIYSPYISRRKYRLFLSKKALLHNNTLQDGFD
jgi:hypothetical protein